MTIYQNLIILFIATIIFGWGAHRFGMPIVVGQLLAGIIIGPSVFKLVSISHELNSIAEIGVLLLMFIVGIETDIKQLLSHIKTSLTVALLGALLPLGTFFLAGTNISLQYGAINILGYRFFCDVSLDYCRGLE
ncbi:cation:proton antiporter [Leuconostoc citreum]|uniref:cation:proton antiporter n=1 Tax=Leuconostoc citreum TaxID=33964 RepID=UPI0010F04867|nr:cation:proton antiporter [Leuconostoc citreum]TDG65430.1 hypothetical protein C5L21_000633 [Leuconostoc citreum]GDZ85444.1 hypothetical protein LCTS_06430 [Leuconostoc citreum]